MWKITGFEVCPSGQAVIKTLGDPTDGNFRGFIARIQIEVLELGGVRSGESDGIRRWVDPEKCACTIIYIEAVTMSVNPQDLRVCGLNAVPICFTRSFHAKFKDDRLSVET